MFKEFKEFATRGNAMDLAVGLILGTAFTGIVNTLVNGVLMPPLGLLLGGADFKDLFVVLKTRCTRWPISHPGRCPIGRSRDS